MIGLLQRVTEASVAVSGQSIGQIGPGLVVLVGIERGDSLDQAVKLAQKLVDYRVFSDSVGKMNLSLRDTGGELLLVPQFTLAADTARGLRPSFSKAAEPAVGQALFTELVTAAKQTGVAVETGEFGADMAVQLINDGPVTFWLQVPPAVK